MTESWLAIRFNVLASNMYAFVLPASPFVPCCLISLRPSLGLLGKKTTTESDRKSNIGWEGTKNNWDLAAGVGSFLFTAGR